MNEIEKMYENAGVRKFEPTEKLTEEEKQQIKEILE